MSRKTKIILLAVAALLLAFPLRMSCGHLYYGCATAPDPGGTYYTYYEIEPLGMTLFETAIGTNLRIYYWAGHDAHSLQK